MSLIRPDIEALEDSPIVEVWRMGYGNPEIIAMFGGESDIPTPAFIREAAAKALAEGHTFYAPNRGIAPMREALIAYNKRIYGIDLPDDRVTLTSSGMNAVMLIAQATVEPGDNVVAITPSWPNILRAMQINGAEPREVALSAGNNGWSLDMDALFAACDARTKVIYLASPGNPTGWMIERAEAERLLDFARARGIAILSDEVYHRLVYEGPGADRGVAFSFLDIARPTDPVFVVNSFSKAWAMTGWRLGWIVYPGGRQGFVRETDPVQLLRRPGISAIWRDRGSAAWRGLREILRGSLSRRPRPGERPAGPHAEGPQHSQHRRLLCDVRGGGRDRYAHFCKRAVLEAKIGMAPGIAFGRGSERFIRLCYAISDEQLTIAMDRLEAFVAGYSET